MNLNGPQHMKQDIENLTQAITEMTVYKPDRPTDLFQFYHPQIRKHFVDAYNLCRLWVENLLYWKCLYPKEAFDTKTAYARKVFIVKSKILREYLDKFFESVCQNFQFVDFIEYKKKDFTSASLTSSQIHKISIKQSVKDLTRFKNKCKMEEELKKGNNCQQLDNKLRYRLFMGYKWDQKGKNNRHRMNLLQKWTQIEPEQKYIFDTRTINHASTGELQLVCQRYIPLRQQVRIE